MVTLKLGTGVHLGNVGLRMWHVMSHYVEPANYRLARGGKPVPGIRQLEKM
jgi:hypothetical protein